MMGRGAASIQPRQPLLQGWSSGSASSPPTATLVLLLPQSWDETPHRALKRRSGLSRGFPCDCWLFLPVLQEHPEAALPG